MRSWPLVGDGVAAGGKVGFEACSEDLVVENASGDVLERGAARWNVLEEVFSVLCRVSVLLSGQKVRRRPWDSVQTGQTPRHRRKVLPFRVPSQLVDFVCSSRIPLALFFVII